MPGPVCQGRLEKSEMGSQRRESRNQKKERIENADI